MILSTDLEREVGRRPYLAPSGAFFIERKLMSYTVNFKEVETTGLETSSSGRCSCRIAGQ